MLESDPFQRLLYHFATTLTSGACFTLLSRLRKGRRQSLEQFGDGLGETDHAEVSEYHEGKNQSQGENGAEKT